MDKIKVQLDKDVANALIKLKEVGDTYSDVIRRLVNYPYMNEGASYEYNACIGIPVFRRLSTNC